jgi:hypothetical protein
MYEIGFEGGLRVSILFFDPEEITPLLMVK